MKESAFFEFTTPILTASSPEGARDFLVPSRLHPGKFYALPQAPQQFKQLIMISGFDRYFQIAPCFRDEDPRADRLPGEFYQIDVEMSFVTQEDVFQTMEPVIRDTFREFAEGKPVTDVFPRIKYFDSLLKYGTDKPDLRNPLIIADVSDEFARDEVTFNAFKNVIKSGGVVRAIPGDRCCLAAAVVLRQAQRMGAHRGRSGPGLCGVRRRGRKDRRQRADRQVHTGRGSGGNPRKGGAESRRRRVLLGRHRGQGRLACRQGTRAYR